MEKLKKLIEENITGILGTIIFHLILLNVFFFVRLSSLKSDKHIEFEIEFEELQNEEELLPKDEKQEFLEEELNNFQSEMKSNIAVNKANQDLAEEINSESFEKEVMKELNMEELFPNNEADISFPEYEESTKQEENQERKEYLGPTNVSFYLKDRSKRYMHIPVYQCEGGGTVKINIVVDQRGYVVNAIVDATATNANSECLELAAIDAAKKSRFNTDYNAPNRQKGTITYQFVAQ